jgi:BRCA1-associated protein
MVLIKFRTAFEADIFIELYDSKPFSEMLIDEVCHVVKISSVEITTTKKPPYTFAFPMVGPEFGSDRGVYLKDAGKLELPTCPVCLERMDSNVSGLITVQCERQLVPFQPARRLTSDHRLPHLPLYVFARVVKQ